MARDCEDGDVGACAASDGSRVGGGRVAGRGGGDRVRIVAVDAPPLARPPTIVRVNPGVSGMRGAEPADDGDD